MGSFSILRVPCMFGALLVAARDVRVCELLNLQCVAKLFNELRQTISKKSFKLKFIK